MSHLTAVLVGGRFDGREYYIKDPESAWGLGFPCIYNNGRVIVYSYFPTERFVAFNKLVFTHVATNVYDSVTDWELYLKTMIEKHNEERGY